MRHTTLALALLSLAGSRLAAQTQAIPADSAREADSLQAQAPSPADSAAASRPGEDRVRRTEAQRARQGGAMERGGHRGNRRHGGEVGGIHTGGGGETRAHRPGGGGERPRHGGGGVEPPRHPDGGGSETPKPKP